MHAGDHAIGGDDQFVVLGERKAGDVVGEAQAALSRQRREKAGDQIVF